MTNICKFKKTCVITLHHLGLLCSFISGDKVKPLLMKSGLPMPVLGHIWYVLCYSVSVVNCVCDDHQLKDNTIHALTFCS